MFQKSCLLKCIATNNKTFMDLTVFDSQNQGVYKTQSSEGSRFQDTTVVKSTPSRIKKTGREWRDTLKKSLNQTIKKSYKRIKTSRRAKITNDTVSTANQTSYNSSIDIFKGATLFSSTLMSNNQTRSYRSVEFENSKFTYPSCQYDSDSDDSDDESGISMSRRIYDNYDDLNSSLSSVSSLEFEPFELSSTAYNNTVSLIAAVNKTTRKSIVKPPLISSSRSNLARESSHRDLDFESCATSSRMNLLTSSTISAYATSLVKREDECSMCCQSTMPAHVICSSTLINNASNTNYCGNLDFGCDQVSASRISVPSFNRSTSSSNSFSAYSSSSSSSLNSLTEQTCHSRICSLACQ